MSNQALQTVCSNGVMPAGRAFGLNIMGVETRIIEWGREGAELPRGSIRSSDSLPP
jgi:hypothetical protein